MSPNLWLALYSANKMSHRARAVTLMRTVFCPLRNHALCFISKISPLICRLLTCSPALYSTVGRFLTLHIWSLLGWVVYTWQVGIKRFFSLFHNDIYDNVNTAAHPDWISESLTKASWFHPCVSSSRPTTWFPVTDKWLFITLWFPVTDKCLFITSTLPC